MEQISFLEIVFWFFAYSVIGWVLEVAYHAVTVGKVVNRGYLCGPLCPVYGCGMLIVLGLAFWVSEGNIQTMNLWLLFATGCVFATLAELIAGWLLDILFHARWWDYSGEHFNLHGYICLKFCLIWGFAITFGIRMIHPVVESITNRFLSHAWSIWIVAAAGALFIADLIVSTAIACGMNKRLKELDAAANALRTISDSASTAITGGTLKVVRPIQEGRVQAALARAELEETVQEKADERRKEREGRKAELRRRQENAQAWFSGNAWFGRRRVLHAFPGMRHERYKDALESLHEHFRKIHKND